MGDQVAARRRDVYMRVGVLGFGNVASGVLAQIGTALADAGVSVSVLHQDRSRHAMTDLIVTTHSIATSQLHAALPALQDAAGPGHSVVIYPVLSTAGSP